MMSACQRTSPKPCAGAHACARFCFLQVENGDLNWILPGKLLAFSGPAARPTDYVGFRAMVPEDYWEYFKKRGVQAIVRLNKKVRLTCCRKEAWHASDCCMKPGTNGLFRTDRMPCMQRRPAISKGVQARDQPAARDQELQ